MMKTKKLFGWGMLGLLGAVGCHATLAGDPDRPIKIEAHVTIDVRQIKEEARSIEDLVSGGGAAAPAKPAAQKPMARLDNWLVPQAFAAELSPEAMAAVNSRRDRYAQLKQYKAQGQIGEDNQAHVKALGGGSAAEALAADENRDRETIYQMQVAQKGLPADAINAIRATFAQEQRERAEPGEKIQLPSGEWVAK